MSSGGVGPERVAGALGLAFLAGIAPACGCEKTETEAARQAEAGRLVHAVQLLRAATAGSRDAELGALRGAACSDPEICRARSVCLSAYDLEASALGEISDVKRAILEPGHPMPSAAPEIMGRAETTLHRSYELATQCADLEGALRRRFGLP